MTPRPASRLFVAFLLCALALTAGCSRRYYDRKHDDYGNLSRNDYRELVNPPPNYTPPQTEVAPPPVPELYPVLAAPEPPAIAPDRKVSIQVTEDVPLKDVLYQLARQAEVDIELDPRIAGGVVFSARNRPFLDVVDRLCRLAGLRYEVEDNLIRVEVDEPYVVTYQAPYLSQIRTTDSNIAISTEVVTPGGEGGAGGNTASSANIAGKAESNFFGELEAGLKALLASTRPRGMELDAGVEPVTLHRQTGMISVFGTSRQHKLIADYLSKLKAAVSAQIMLEAKVVEVRLREGFRSGIDWNAVFGTKFSIAAPLTTAALSPAANNLSTFSLTTGDFSGILSLVEEFGTTRTLSSPRVTVMNNQTAILKVANNEVFFELDVEREDLDNTTGTGGVQSRLNVDSTIRTIPIGLVMVVQPSINLKTEEVTLTLRPTITRITDFRDDPAVQFINSELPAGERVQSQIPVVEVREVDSVLRLHSGEIAVLGGLMQQSTFLQDDGLPGFSEAGLLGRAFKNRDEQNEVTELVVLLRTVIVDQPRPDDTDYRAYKTYSQDPRPLTF